MTGDLVTLSPAELGKLRVWGLQRSARCPCCGARGFRRIRPLRNVGGEMLHYCRRGHPYYVPGLA